MAVDTSKWKQEDLDAIAAAGAAWNAAGTQAEKDAAHAAAEAVRAKYGYTGGTDGSNLTALPTTSNASGNNQYTALGAGSDYYANQYITSAADRALLQSYGDAYNASIAAGDRAGADAAHAGAEALRAKYGYVGGTDGSQYISVPATSSGFEYAAAPTYNDPYAARIDELLNQILNRDAFSYDAATDPLYAQYKEQYTREGQRAMQDTLGQVAARTGGLASSYAVSAAQQQNNYYMQQLSDKVPELYQLAYQMYLDNMDMDVQKYGLLEGASDRQYDRFRDTMADWRDDRDFAYNQYRDDVADGKWETEFAYGANRDQVADSQWQQSFDRDVYESDRDYEYNVGRDEIEDKRYDEEWAYQQAQNALAQSNWEREFAYQKEQDALGNTGSGGGGGGSVSDNNPTKAPADEPAVDEPVEPDGDYPTREDRDNVNQLGLAMVKDETIYDLIQYGGLIDRDGKLDWAAGWNKDNYQTMLQKAKDGRSPELTGGNGIVIDPFWYIR